MGAISGGGGEQMRIQQQQRQQPARERQTQQQAPAVNQNQATSIGNNIANQPSARTESSERVIYDGKVPENIGVLMTPSDWAALKEQGSLRVRQTTSEMESNEGVFTIAAKFAACFVGPSRSIGALSIDPMFLEMIKDPNAEVGLGYTRVKSSTLQVIPSPRADAPPAEATPPKVPPYTPPNLQNQSPIDYETTEEAREESAELQDPVTTTTQPGEAPAASPDTFVMTTTESWLDHDANLDQTKNRTAAHNNTTLSAGFQQMIGGNPNMNTINYAITSTYLDNGQFAQGVDNGTRNGREMGNTVATYGSEFLGREIIQNRGGGKYAEYNDNYNFMTLGSMQRIPVKGDANLTRDYVDLRVADFKRQNPGATEQDLNNVRSAATTEIASSTPVSKDGKSYSTPSAADVFMLKSQNTMIGTGNETRDLRERYSALLKKAPGIDIPADDPRFNNISMADFYAVQFNSAVKAAGRPQEAITMTVGSDGRVQGMDQNELKKTSNFRVVAETNFGRRVGESLTFGNDRINDYVRRTNTSATTEQLQDRMLTRDDAADIGVPVQQLTDKLEELGLGFTDQTNGQSVPPSGEAFRSKGQQSDLIMTRGGEPVTLVPGNSGRGMHQQIENIYNGLPAELKTKHAHVMSQLGQSPSVVKVKDMAAMLTDARSRGIDVSDRLFNRVAKDQKVASITDQEWKAVLGTGNQAGMLAEDGPKAKQQARDGNFVVVGPAGGTTTTPGRTITTYDTTKVGGNIAQFNRAGVLSGPPPADPTAAGIDKDWGKLSQLDTQITKMLENPDQPGIANQEIVPPIQITVDGKPRNAKFSDWFQMDGSVIKKDEAGKPLPGPARAAVVDQATKPGQLVSNGVNSQDVVAKRLAGNLNILQTMNADPRNIDPRAYPPFQSRINEDIGKLAAMDPNTPVVNPLTNQKTTVGALLTELVGEPATITDPETNQPKQVYSKWDNLETMIALKAVAGDKEVRESGTPPTTEQTQQQASKFREYVQKILADGKISTDEKQDLQNTVDNMTINLGNQLAGKVDGFFKPAQLTEMRRDIPPEPAKPPEPVTPKAKADYDKAKKDYDTARHHFAIQIAAALKTLPPVSIQAANLPENVLSTIEEVNSCQACLNVATEGSLTSSMYQSVQKLNQRLDEFHAVGVAKKAFAGEMQRYANEKPEPTAFNTIIKTAYGIDPKSTAGKALLTQAQNGTLPFPPNVRFVDRAQLGGANGGYIGNIKDTNGRDKGAAILLSRDLLSNPDLLRDVFTEEMFHHLERQSPVQQGLGNTSTDPNGPKIDAEGDEGRVGLYAMRQARTVNRSEKDIEDAGKKGKLEEANVGGLVERSPDGIVDQGQLTSTQTAGVGMGFDDFVIPANEKIEFNSSPAPGTIVRGANDTYTGDISEIESTLPTFRSAPGFKPEGTYVENREGTPGYNKWPNVTTPIQNMNPQEVSERQLELPAQLKYANDLYNTNARTLNALPGFEPKLPEVPRDNANSLDFQAMLEAADKYAKDPKNIDAILTAKLEDIKDPVMRDVVKGLQELNATDPAKARQAISTMLGDIPKAIASAQASATRLHTEAQTNPRGVDQGSTTAQNFGSNSPATETPQGGSQQALTTDAEKPDWKESVMKVMQPLGRGLQQLGAQLMNIMDAQLEKLKQLWYGPGGVLSNLQSSILAHDVIYGKGGGHGHDADAAVGREDQRDGKDRNHIQRASGSFTGTSPDYAGVAQANQSKSDEYRQKQMFADSQEIRARQNRQKNGNAEAQLA